MWNPCFSIGCHVMLQAKWKPILFATTLFLWFTGKKLVHDNQCLQSICKLLWIGYKRYLMISSQREILAITGSSRKFLTGEFEFVYSILVCIQTKCWHNFKYGHQFHIDAQLVVGQHIQRWKTKFHNALIVTSWNVKRFESFHLSWTSV